MFCPKCGKPIPEQNRFCSFCGWRIPDPTGQDVIKKEQSGQKKGKGMLIALIISSVVLLVLIALILYVLGVFKTNKTEPPAVSENAPGAVVQTDSADPSPEEAESDPFPYSFRVETCTWTQACEKAKAAGGRLATFDSREEYDAVIARLDEAGLRKTEFRLGARRDENGTGYCWIDENGELTGEALNDPESWAYPLWAEGEPTFQWEEYTETTLVLYYDEGAGRWCLNDIPDEPYGTDRYGYIIAYDGPAQGEQTGEEAPAQAPSGENDAPELARSAAEWLGTWTADSGECIDVSGVTDTGVSCVFYKQDEAGGWIEASYEMEFDDASKSVVSEPGGPEDHGGWEYRFVLEHGYLTVESRYPNQAFYQAPAVIGDEDLAALEDFLDGFSPYFDDYDCRLAATARNNSDQNILEFLIGPFNFVDDPAYPGERVQKFYNQFDPKNRWDSYARIDEVRITWTLKHILNCSDADITSLNSQLPELSDEKNNRYYTDPYYLDGYYYRFHGGVGWVESSRIIEYSFDGTNYLVNYILETSGVTDDRTRCAVLRLKTIGGQKYWSLYYDGTEFPEDMDFSCGNEDASAEPEQPSPALYTQDDMNATAQTFGQIKLWEYHDYDGDGTYEAFFLTVDPDSDIGKIDKIYFIDSACAVTLMADDIDLSIYDSDDGYYLECQGKGFFWGNYGGYGSGHLTFLFGVKNGGPYELDISRNLQGIICENGTYYTTWNDFSAGYHKRPKYELQYDAENQQFVQGAKVSDDIMEES